ncbi:probable G-protein coupled receptor CG31760 [Paramacrobiotus metropolitanus]|uniref:probable G-protein coupled receptor CG31760 n=1 Tax=Paramacrobiotus metropolitanus TaxID=2943436 RepID=UPI002445F2C1|nr:probable G-protein coupled receptor CG31760 [Paramacrobiotus metropolitanus]
MYRGSNHQLQILCYLVTLWINVAAEYRYETATIASRLDSDISKQILSNVDKLKSHEDLLDVITNLTTGILCSYNREIAIPVKFNTSKYFPDLLKAALWVSKFLVDYIQTSGQNFETPMDKGYKFVHRSVTNLFDYEPRLVYIAIRLPPTQEEQIKILELLREPNPIHSVIKHKTSTLGSGSIEPDSYDILIASRSHVYYSCPLGKWLTKISLPLNLTTSHLDSNPKSLSAAMVLAADITEWDIYQCDKRNISEVASGNQRERLIIDHFAGTAKCHKDTNDCVFRPGSGWRKDSYSCRCKSSYYFLDDGAQLPSFSSWHNDSTQATSAGIPPDHMATTYPTASRGVTGPPGPGSKMMRAAPAACALCHPDCDTCTNGSPCFYAYNRAIRIILLSITALCIVSTLILGIFIHRYRRVKVIRVASPKFLYITLLGAAVMYSEMIAIFFEDRPDIYICMAIEWTRHLGFGITYSSLFMKTWRISGLFRVKSAHKIKLTDKQLLQWMCPILLIMVIYLATWSAGAPATPEILANEFGQRYYQCAYGWWDHCLVVGNVTFLLWGIRVCYRVRNAESYFNEAKFISFAIYNIAGVNAIFLLLHLVVYPQASPDIKFVFAFLRIQFSTTVTVCLVFCPKVSAIMRGQGENFEFRDRPGAQIPLNGGPVSQDEVIDVYQENEDLKDEIQKLASQIEWMKIVHMNIGNRHLKLKHSSAQYHIATSYFPPSPILRSLRRRSSDAQEMHTVARMSPAAELSSERV